MSLSVVFLVKTNSNQTSEMNTRNAISIRINQFPSIFFLVFFCKLKVSDGIQEGDVCFKWDGNCCSKKVNIRIRNCSSFFVYKLNNKISCQYAYCGNGQWLGEVFSNETGSELTHCISQSFLTLLSAQHSWYQDNIFIYNILSRF